MKGTIFCFVVFISIGHCISFNLEASERFCLGEDAIAGDFLLGTFKYDRNANVEGAIILTISDPFTTTIFESTDKSGSVSIDVKQDGIYDICFFNTGPTVRSVTLEIKNTLKNSKNDDLVKKKHVDPLVYQLQDIIESAKHLSVDLRHIKQREWQMRDINEATNSRVLVLSFLSMFIFIATAIFKVFYLKGFFAKKKLI